MASGHEPKIFMGGEIIIVIYEDH
ncbi:MAG: hypothetical protein QOH35_3765, partial [Acidobacteriaceae bacterium]|nr:hypothetical protein [Acidobacteriaceae bacterium]